MQYLQLEDDLIVHQEGIEPRRFLQLSVHLDHGPLEHVCLQALHREIERDGATSRGHDALLLLLLPTECRLLPKCGSSPLAFSELSSSTSSAPAGSGSGSGSGAGSGVATARSKHVLSSAQVNQNHRTPHSASEAEAEAEAAVLAKWSPAACVSVLDAEVRVGRYRAAAAHERNMQE